MPATVLTHVYNEELLLPFWLRHHRELFDHGVLVDRGSTDRSREIIRELAPDWDVVPSRNALFDARDTDLEMMGLERRFGGWKVVLNVTELLLHDDLRGHLHAIERSAPQTRSIGVPVITMVDAPHEHGCELDERPLFCQRHHHAPRIAGNLRFLHREAHGGYGAGRHAISAPYVVDDGLVVLKYTWSPYPQVRARRLQIAGGIPDADVSLGMSWGLFFTGEELDEQFAGLSSAARDLHEDPRIAVVLARLRGGYARRPREPVPRLPPDRRRRVAVVAGEGAGSHAAELATALRAGHDVSTVAADQAAGVLVLAEVGVIDPSAFAAPHVGASHLPLAVDLRGSAAADASEALLLRGDFFVWDAESASAWIERFAAVGRLGDARDVDPAQLALLGTAIAPGAPAADLAARLEPFLEAPRRTTTRLARDSTIPASRIAYFRRHKAAIDVVLDTAGALIAATNENARLREANARLHEENARLSADAAG